MARYKASLDFAKSPNELFDYMADFANAAEWDPATAIGERIGDGPLGVGSRFRIVTEFGGKEMELTYEVVEYDPPRRVVLRTFNGKTKIEDKMTVVPVDGGSALTYNAQITFAGIAKVMDPFATLIFRRIGNNAIGGLRSALGPPPG